MFLHIYFLNVSQSADLIESWFFYIKSQNYIYSYYFYSNFIYNGDSFVLLLHSEFCVIGFPKNSVGLKRAEG